VARLQTAAILNRYMLDVPAAPSAQQLGICCHNSSSKQTDTHLSLLPAAADPEMAGLVVCVLLPLQWCGQGSVSSGAQGLAQGQALWFHGTP
jgi:hypothetical protein